MWRTGALNSISTKNYQIQFLPKIKNKEIIRILKLDDQYFVRTIIFVLDGRYSEKKNEDWLFSGK